MYKQKNNLAALIWRKVSNILNHQDQRELKIGFKKEVTRKESIFLSQELFKERERNEWKKTTLKISDQL